MVDNQIVVLAGFSSAGKDSFAEILQKDHGYNFVTSHTTRPVREGESQGNPYHFVSKEDMLGMIANDELIEYRTYDTLVDGKPDTWYYAAHKSEVHSDKKYVCVLDMLGLEEFIEVFGDRVTGVFIEVPHEVREERAKLRGSFDKTEWDRRLEDDIKVFSDERIKKSCKFTIQNIDKNVALKELLQIL